MDGGAWWAAVHGVAKSRTRLKRLSSKCLKLSGLDLGSAYNPGPASDSFQQSNLEPKQSRQGKHTHREQGQTQCGRDIVSTPSIIILQRPSLPTAQLNK